MERMTIEQLDARLAELNAKGIDTSFIVKAKENNEDGFSTSEKAWEFGNNEIDQWGSNLVIVRIDEVNGRFFVRFNIFD